MITRTPRGTEAEIPLVLPLVEATANPGGTFDVTVEGGPYDSAGACDRVGLTRIIRDVADDLGLPVRVKIQERDGSQYTDIVTPSELPTSDHREFGPTLRSEPVSCGGFVPGELIAVAVVVAHRAAKADGTAGLSLPSGLLGQQRDLVLMGRTSGTVIVVDEHP